MFLSVFDIFKVGVGPSSSHTMGPMVAAGRFLAALRDGTDRIPGSGEPARLGCRLHGSLAFTGKGHATDRAVTLGLAGFDPGAFDAARAAEALARIAATRAGAAAGPAAAAASTRRTDLVFDYGPPLPGHANGLVLQALDAAGNLHLQETYYSIGGGFVVTARELARPAGRRRRARRPLPVPLGGGAPRAGRGDRPRHRRARSARTSSRGATRPSLDAGARAALGGDGRLHRPRARRRGRAAGRAQGAPARAGRSTSGCWPSAGRT